MKGVSGNQFSLNDLKLKNGLLVVFSCNTCPFVIGNKSMDGWENRYNDLYEFCKLQDIGMVLVNSNEAKEIKAILTLICKNTVSMKNMTLLMY